MNSLNISNEPKIIFSSLFKGSEFPVLMTLPWNKVDIEVILVELIHAGEVHQGSRYEIHQFLQSKSYTYLGTIGKT